MTSRLEGSLSGEDASNCWIEMVGVQFVLVLFDVLIHGTRFGPHNFSRLHSLGTVSVMY